MYNLIYDFFMTHFFNDSTLGAYSTEIMGVETSMNNWLAHTLTIVSFVLLFIFLVIFIKWVFKVVSGLMRW